MLKPWPRVDELLPQIPPADSPSAWTPLLGHYGDEQGPIVLERDGRLCVYVDATTMRFLDQQSPDCFLGDGLTVRFLRDDRSNVRGVMLGDQWHPRRHVGPDEGSDQMLVQSVAPLADIIRQARSMSPPVESGDFRADDLVDLGSLDPALIIDLRYASAHNFLSAVFYDEARALLQRPVADAVIRVHTRLRAAGFGLTVLDAYRPWSVTQAFWDAMPLASRWMVADPANTSKHNRGAAIDLTLHDLGTGLPVSMPSTFDEPTPRAYAFYPGGTTRQRWHRGLLRTAMEAEGFLLNPFEWWHFDHPDWRAYRVGNVSIGDVR
ncbi:MAG: M15 family metallopeptidase [Vicinamibacterales bacterium]